MPGRTPDRGQGWVALLRGINLGARNKVPMAGLRALLEGLDCTSVRTYIQSGNVLFERHAADRAALAAELQAAVAAEFGVSSTIVLRTFRELRRVADGHPFGADTSRTHVSFLAGRPGAEGARRLAAVEATPDRFVLAGSDLYLHFPNGVQGARLSGPVLERSLGVAGTIRNWRTVTRLAELTAP